MGPSSDAQRRPHVLCVPPLSTSASPDPASAPAPLSGSQLTASRPLLIFVWSLRPQTVQQSRSPEGALSSDGSEQLPSFFPSQTKLMVFLQNTSSPAPVPVAGISICLLTAAEAEISARAFAPLPSRLRLGSAAKSVGLPFLSGTGIRSRVSLSPR